MCSRVPDILCIPKHSLCVSHFPCCSGPVSLFASIFASDTFYQDLATRTAEECRVPSCLQIFEIVLAELLVSHAVPTIFALVCVHITCCVAVFAASCANELSFRTPCMVFYCMHRPCLCMELLHAHVTTMHFCVALVVRHLLSADATDVCFFVVAPALRCSFRGIVQLVAS